MSQKALFGGLVLGALLGAGGLFVVQTQLLVPTDCGTTCGEGTVCEGTQCVVAAADEEPEAEVEEEAEPGKKKRRKKKGKSGGGDDGGGAGGPAVDDDSKVPGFDANKDQSISMSDGTGRLSDAVIDRELAKLDKDFQRCVLDANDRVADLGTGRVSIKFGVDGKGKVTGVNVGAPSNLENAGLVPCVRKAVYGHSFPAFDGPEMKVSTSFTVD